MNHRPHSRPDPCSPAGGIEAGSANDLAVVCCHFNPFHYRSRLRNYQRFAALFALTDVRLLTVELAFGEDPWELPGGEHVMQIRTRDVMWQKECLLNRGIRQLLDDGYDKIAWIDADVSFHDPTWPIHASNALNDHKLIQLFDTVHRLQCSGPPEAKKGSAAKICESGHLDTNNATPGYGWAARADVLAAVPLYDAMIVGGGDAAVFLASCYGIRRWRERLARQHWFRSMNRACRRHYLQWAERWGRMIGGRFGYLPQHASAFYHGSNRNRQFHKRLKRVSSFDPERHVVRCPKGCWQWATDDWSMQEEVRDYFRVRAEDDCELPALADRC